MVFPLDPDPQYRPQTLANLTAATGAAHYYVDHHPDIDAANAVGVDVSSLIPKVFGYLSGTYATEDVPATPAQPGDTPVQISEDGYFGPGLPRPGGPMPPFPPPTGPGGPAAFSKQNYGQPSIKNNASPGSLILLWSVGHSAATPTAQVVDDTTQSELAVPLQNKPWADEVMTIKVDLV